MQGSRWQYWVGICEIPWGLEMHPPIENIKFHICKNTPSIIPVISLVKHKFTPSLYLIMIQVTIISCTIYVFSDNEELIFYYKFCIWTATFPIHIFIIIVWSHWIPTINCKGKLNISLLLYLTGIEMVQEFLEHCGDSHVLNCLEKNPGVIFWDCMAGSGGCVGGG